MAIVSWKPNADGAWSVAANWSTGKLPTSADTVLLGSTAAHVVTHASGTDTVSSITATTDRLTVSGGSLSVTAASSLAAGLTEAGGALTLDGNTSVAGGFIQTAGTISIGGSATLTLAGAASLSAGLISGTGTIATTGTTTLASGSHGGLMSLDGGLTWSNSGKVLDAVSLFLGFPSGLGTVTIVNAAAGVFDLTTNGAAIYNDGTDATFVNGGTLSKTLGNGTTNVYAAVTNTGTLTAIAGTLELDGGGILGGTVGAAKGAALALGYGDFTLASAAQTITGQLMINGGTISLGQGQTLTLSGATGMTSGQFYGPGTLVTTGATSITGVIDMDGGLAWTNSGTVSNLGEVELNYPSGVGGIVITNSATGVFDLTQDGWGIYSYLAATATLANAGTLSKTAGTGTSNIFAAVSNTGRLTATTGTLELDGGGTLGGTIGATKTGTLALGNGTFGLAGVTQTITGAVALDGGTLSLAAGDTLTLSGAVALSSGGIVGPGTLVTTGVTSLTTPIGLDGGLTWVNLGTFHDAGQLNLDYPSFKGVVAIDNNASGVLDLTADGNTIVNYGADAILTNAGTLSKTLGTGTSALSITVNNTGTLTATSGTLELDGGGSLGGTIGAAKAGILALATGTFTLAGNTQTITGALTLDGGTLLVGTGQTLTLTGAVGFSSGAITGAGTLATTGSLNSTGSSDAIATAVSNSGTIDVAAGTTLALSGGVSGNGGLTIEAGATLEIGQSLGTGQVVTFNGPAATLKLDTAASITTRLQGFGVGNSIDLAGVALTSVSILGKVLTLKAGATTHTVTASTTLAGDRAQLLPDGSGGSIVTLYATAVAAVHTPEPVLFGKVHVGDVATRTLTVSNKAVAGPYTETLDGSLSAVTKGFITAGTISGLIAGASNSTALTITENTTAAGALSGSTKLGLESDGTGIDGLGKLALPSQTVTMSGGVYAYAAPQLSTTSLTLAARIGGVISGAVTLADGPAASAYQESLVYAASGPKGVTITHATGTIAAGGEAALNVSMASTTAGSFAGEAVVVGLTSTGLGTSGLAATTLASQTVTVNARVYAVAVAKLAATTVNLGIVHVGAVATGSVAVTNAGTGGLVDVLTAGPATTSGGVTGVVTNLGTSGLAEAATGSVQLTVGTAAAGTISGAAVVGFVSHDGDLADQALASDTIKVTGTVNNYALARIEQVGGAGTLARSVNAYVLNLGTVAQNGTALVSDLGVLNAATGPADLLSGGFTASGAAAFTNTGLTAFSGLAAGADERKQVVTLSTGTAGVFTETIVLNPAGGNASGYSGVLANETITVTGTVLSALALVQGASYTLTTAATVITGTPGNDVINAAANTLLARDSIDGGAGSNTLHLTGAGAGAFDLATPKTLTDIQIVTASESTAGTTVTMRAGLNVTLDVAAGGTGAVTIQGAADNDVYNLGAGTDTVVLGAATEAVHGGGGTALAQATAARAGALVTGTTTGTTTLELTTGGNATLNAADTHLIVQLDAATNLGLGAATFVSVTGTAAALSGDTITGFGGGDTIDITDLTLAALKSLTYGGTTTAGTLTVNDGGHSATIAMGGDYTIANFSHVSDGHGGLLIGFVPH